MTPLIYFGIAFYFGIALYAMGSDARQTYWDKIHYDWKGSLVCAIFWPVIAIISIVGIISKEE